jgi:hypothetical protein
MGALLGGIGALLGGMGALLGGIGALLGGMGALLGGIGGLGVIGANCWAIATPANKIAVNKIRSAILFIIAIFQASPDSDFDTSTYVAVGKGFIDFGIGVFLGL